MNLLFLLRMAHPLPKALSLRKPQLKYHILRVLISCSSGPLQQVMAHRVPGLATIRVRVKWQILLFGLWRPPVLS